MATDVSGLLSIKSSGLRRLMDEEFVTAKGTVIDSRRGPFSPMLVRAEEGRLCSETAFPSTSPRVTFSAAARTPGPRRGTGRVDHSGKRTQLGISRPALCVKKRLIPSARMREVKADN